MITVLLLLGLLIAVLLSGYFSGTETGVYCLNHVRLRVAVDRNEPGARRLDRLMRHPEDLVITALLGTNVADYLATACTASLFLHTAISGNLAEIYATAVVTPLIFVFGGIVPKDWFRRESNSLLMRLSATMLACRAAARFTGLLWLLRTLAHWLARRLAPNRATADAPLLERTRMLHLLREGAVRGGLTPVQRDLIERVLRFADARCQDVMVPRPRTATVPRDIDRTDFLRIARMAHFSRLAVHDGDPRRIVGTINVYDVLTDTEDRAVAEHVRPPLTLSARTPVAAALLRLQRARQAMAIIVDATGEFLGLLTVKDLVEEIVGELEVW